jgi:hypothetical protein
MPRRCTGITVAPEAGRLVGGRNQDSIAAQGPAVKLRISQLASIRRQAG